LIAWKLPSEKLSSRPAERKEQIAEIRDVIESIEKVGAVPRLYVSEEAMHGGMISCNARYDSSATFSPMSEKSS
jgi:hypothetical protein